MNTITITFKQDRIKRKRENNKLCTKLSRMCEIRQKRTNRMSLSLRKLTEIGREKEKEKVG